MSDYPFTYILDNKAVKQIATKEFVVGKEISEVCLYGGTYGMGGPGFACFKFKEEPKRGRKPAWHKGIWLTCTLWGSDSWMFLNGRQVASSPNCPCNNPWVDDKDEFTPEIVGRTITDFLSLKDRTVITLDNGSKLEVPPNSYFEKAGGDLTDMWVIADTCVIQI